MTPSVSDFNLFDAAPPDFTPPGVETVLRLNGPGYTESVTIGEVESRRWQPQTQGDAADFLALAHHQRQAVFLGPQDLRRCQQPGAWLDLSRLNRVVRHRKDDLMITVETGITMGMLQSILAVEGQQFPLDYPEHWLLADVLAMDTPSFETGPLGYPRDYVLGLTFAAPDGRLTRYGGEVAKNVTGYDLNKLYVGNRHRLGVITQATLKLAGKPKADISASLSVIGEAALQALVGACQGLDSLRQCEVVYESRSAYDDAQARLILRLAGEPAVMRVERDRLTAACQALSIEADWTPAASLWQRVFDGSLNDCVLELATAPGCPPLYLSSLVNHLSEETPHRIQFRPLAGLSYVHFASIQHPDAFDAELLSFAQGLRHPQGYRQGLLQCYGGQSGSWQRQRALVSAQTDAVTARLLERLKASYDPNHVLPGRELTLP